MKNTITIKLTIALCLLPFLSQADITVEKHLNFGKVAILDNATSSTITIFSNGTQSTHANIVAITKGYPGRYLLSNFPPSTQLSISLSSGSTLSSFAGAPPPTQFYIEPYLDFSLWQTDALGEVTLLVPGNLRTTGDGNSYQDGTYYRYYDLTINY